MAHLPHSGGIIFVFLSVSQPLRITMGLLGVCANKGTGQSDRIEADIWVVGR